MTNTTLTTGTRIWNNGDMANQSHFGTVTKVESDKWGTHYEITPDEDAERGPYIISAAMVSKEFKGHSGTRIVTEAAYRAFREQQIAAFHAARK